MVAGVGIEFDLRRSGQVRDMLGRFISNTPKVADEIGRRVLTKIYNKELEKRARQKRFMGVLESIFIGGRAVKKVGKGEYVIKAPRYIFFIDRGTRPHWVSIKEHPIVWRWIMKKGNPLRVRRRGNSVFIRSKPSRIIRDSIITGNQAFRTQVKSDVRTYVNSKGRGI